jgi:hypothetical protein
MDTSGAMEIFRQILFEKEIHLFKDYLETLEEFLRTEAQHLAQSLETLDLGYEPLPEERDGARDEDDFEAKHERYYEPSPRQVEDQLRDRLNVIDDFANLLRSSFFVSLYSFLESRLMKECQSRTGADVTLSLSDIRGLERIKKYFKKVQIYFPSDTTQWQEIQNYKVLRNCIVHTRGRLSDFGNAKQLEKYIRRKSGLHISGDEIFLNAAFCSEAFETVKGFFCLLISSGHC